MTNCKNCGSELTGKYCSNCSQKADIHRFALKHFIHEFVHTFTHVDKGILYLMKEMFLRPGIVTREYLEGKRKKYFNPFQYLVLGIAVSFFLTVKLGVIGYRTVSPDVLAGFNQQQLFFLQFNNFIYTYFNIIIFSGIPLMAFFSWIFYRKSGYNYTENLVFQTFIGAQRNLIYILLMPFLYILKEKWIWGIGTYYMIFIIYYGLAYLQFFPGNKIVNLAKYILSFAVSLIVIQFSYMAFFYFFLFKP